MAHQYILLKIGPPEVEISVLEAGELCRLAVLDYFKRRSFAL